MIIIVMAAICVAGLFALVETLVEAPPEVPRWFYVAWAFLWGAVWQGYARR